MTIIIIHQHKDNAIRHCGLDGRWLDQNNQSSVVGWTDFLECFPPHLQELLENISRSIDGFSSKLEVATWVRFIEFIGLVLSALALSGSIFVFSTFPRLINSRTRIHRHLFSVLLVQALTTLFIYIDQEMYQILQQKNNICILIYSFYEFLASISFSFMLIEGINLYRLISSSALRPQIPYRLLIISGYLFPILNGITWFATASYKYGWSSNSRCWFGYNLDKIYWILQGPRLIVLLCNLMFMGLVIRTLVKKITDNDMKEMHRIRSALRATVFLMPLLGITNFISMLDAPVKDTTVAFAAWASCAYFLRSMQGLFVSIVYCIRNKEVLRVLLPKLNQMENEQNDQGIDLKEMVVEIISCKDAPRLESPVTPQPSVAQSISPSELESPDTPQPSVAQSIFPSNDTIIDIDSEYERLFENYFTTKITVHQSSELRPSDKLKECV